MGRVLRIALCVGLLVQLVVGLARAGPASLLGDASPRPALLEQGTGGASLFQAALPGAAPLGAGAAPGSLFNAARAAAFFSPATPQSHPAVPSMAARLGVAGLKDFIARAEAGKAQYDAVVFSAHIKPPRRPTELSIAEIYRWIEDTPGQNHAIGRYQFIPPTLRALVKRANLPTDVRFSEDVQDRLAMLLLEDAGLSRFLAGDLSQQGFMNNLAKIWAGLPNSSGKSHYHGFAGNKATTSWAAFSEAIDRYFPRG